jgi:hypothetical protein
MIEAFLKPYWRHEHGVESYREWDCVFLTSVDHPNLRIRPVFLSLYHSVIKTAQINKTNERSTDLQQIGDKIKLS